MFQQIIRFLFSGGIATLVQYAILWLGVDLLEWPAAVSSGLGYLAGSAFNYLSNYFFTFSRNRPHRQAAFRFYVMVAVGWGINTSVMAVLVDAMVWNKWLSQVLATVLALVWNFAVSRVWVF